MQSQENASSAFYGVISMRIRYAACCVTAFASGCATVPDYRDDEITTADVITSIKCELRNAAWRMHPENRIYFSGWNAGFIVELQVFHKGGQESDASFVVPLHPGTFTLGLTSGLTGEATRTERINFSEKLSDLNADRGLVCPGEHPRGRYALLGGELGMADLFNRARESIAQARIQPTQLDYNIEFIIRMDGSISPKFSMIPIGNDRTLSAGLKLLGSRKDTHSLKLVLKPPPERVAVACAVELEHGRCPTPVYTVTPKPKEPRAGEAAPFTEQAPAGPPSKPRRGLSPEEQRDIERGLNQNILQGIDQDTLREEGLGD